MNKQELKYTRITLAIGTIAGFLAGLSVSLLWRIL